MGWIAEGKIDQVGTFNGNPLTMAAMPPTLTEILTPRPTRSSTGWARSCATGATGSSSAPAWPATRP